MAIVIDDIARRLARTPSYLNLKRLNHSDATMPAESVTIETTEKSEDGAEVTGESYCKNCEATLAGRFCSACGQDSTNAIVPLRTFLKQGVEDLLSFDFRYPRTLKALWFPGRLTARYLEGQRVDFVPPLKLVFNVSVLLFVVVALTAPESSKVTINSELSADLGYFAREYALWLTLGQLLVLPLWAGIVFLGFRTQKPLYLSHLIFALHFHTAVTLAFILSALVLFILPIQVAAWFILVIVIWIYGPYLTRSLKRVYAASWKRTLLYGIVALVSYLSLLIMVSSIIGAFTLGSLENG